MAIAIGANPAYLNLELKMVDIFGQPVTKRIPLGGAVTDSDVLAIVTGYDALSNCHIVDAKLVSARAITGMKSSASNAIERKVSDVLELAFDVVNANGKPLTRAILIHAPVAAAMTLSGAPSSSNGTLDALVSKLASDLYYVDSSGAGQTGGFTYNSTESHQISLADVVDTQ